MKITAITRYKHGELLDVLTRLGWTQSDLANKAGIAATTVSKIMCLNVRPNQTTANAIQKAIGEAGIYFDVLTQWPETFKGIKSGAVRKETIDVPLESLIGCQEAMKIAAPQEYRLDELNAELTKALSTLPPKHRRIVELRFFRGKTIAETAEVVGLSRGRVDQITQRALRELRHPSRIKTLAQFLNI